MAGMVALLLFGFFALLGYAISGWAQEREDAKEALGRRLTTMTGATLGAASAAVMKHQRLSRIGLLHTHLQRLSITTSLGLTVREALQHLTERMEDPNLPILATGVVITQEVGGNLAEVLDNISYTIRERFKLLREVRVLTAQGRLSGMVLTGLPFFVAVSLILFNPEYFKPMMESRTGLYMIGYGICSIVLGHVLIQRIVRIKV